MTAESVALQAAEVGGPKEVNASAVTVKANWRSEGGESVGGRGESEGDGSSSVSECDEI